VEAGGRLRGGDDGVRAGRDAGGVGLLVPAVRKAGGHHRLEAGDVEPVVPVFRKARRMIERS